MSGLERLDARLIARHHGEHLVECAACDGEGDVDAGYDEDDDRHGEREECEACEGCGMVEPESEDFDPPDLLTGRPW